MVAAWFMGSLRNIHWLTREMLWYASIRFGIMKNLYCFDHYSSLMPYSQDGQCSRRVTRAPLHNGSDQKSE